MSLGHGSSIVRNGLVLHLDAANRKSYPGSGTAWADLSGNGNSGTLLNGVGYNSVNNGSLVFDKVNDHVSVIPINRDIYTTIEIVFKTNSISTNTSVRQYLYTQQRNPPALAQYTYQERHGIFIAGNKIQFQYMNELNNSHMIQAEIVLEINRWYHATVTLDYDIGKWFINGVEQSITRTTEDNAFVSTNRKAKPVTVNQGRIGLRGDAQGNDYFGGNIAMVRDYNRALTATEIKQNFEATRSRYGI
jgi:hypothetical protein